MVLSFSLISKALQDAVDEKGKPKFSDSEIAFIGTISALAIAMAGFGVVKSLLSEYAGKKNKVVTVIPGQP